MLAYFVAYNTLLAHALGLLARFLGLPHCYLLPPAPSHETAYTVFIMAYRTRSCQAQPWPKWTSQVVHSCEHCSQPTAQFLEDFWKLIVPGNDYSRISREIWGAIDAESPASDRPVIASHIARRTNKVLQNFYLQFHINKQRVHT